LIAADEKAPEVGAFLFNRHCERSEAIHGRLPQLDCFVAELAMTEK